MQPPASTGVPCCLGAHHTTTMPRGAIALPEKIAHVSHQFPASCCYRMHSFAWPVALSASCCYLDNDALIVDVVAPTYSAFNPPSVLIHDIPDGTLGASGIPARTW